MYDTLKTNEIILKFNGLHFHLDSFQTLEILHNMKILLKGLT